MSASLNAEGERLLSTYDEPLQKPKGCMDVLKKGAAGFTLLLMIGSWIAEGEFVQRLQSPDPDKYPDRVGYTNNFMLSYCTRIGWAFILLGWFAWSQFFFNPNRGGRKISANGVFGWKMYMKWASILGVVIFASTYTWYFSLAGTSVAGNSAVYQSAPVFVFIFSIPLLNEKVTPLKVMAVCLCVGGSAVVAFLGQSDPNIMDQNVVVNGTINITGFDWNATSSSAALLPSLSSSSHQETAFGPFGYDQFGNSNGTKIPSKYGVASVVMVPAANATTKNSTVAWCAASCNKLSSCDAITVHTANASCARYTCTAPCSVLNVATPVATDFSELIRASASENTAGGYAWCLGSVVLYAAYEVVYKKYVTDSNDPVPIANSQRFLGLIGVMTLVLVWPLFFLLNEVPGLDTKAMPDQAWQWEYIFVIAACDTSFNLFLLLTIVLTSPLFTSVGTILVIPISTLVDYELNGTLLPARAFIGVGMIICGFAAIVYAEFLDHTAKHSKSNDAYY